MRAHSRGAAEPKPQIPGHCWCGAVSFVKCLCGRQRCGDHAVMTADGVRCDACMAAGEEGVEPRGAIR